MTKIVFYGDSITEQFEALNEFEHIINLGIGGDKTVELIGRFRQVYAAKPDRLFIMIGINDYLVNQGVWAHGFKIPFKKTYDVLMDLIKTNLPNTDVYLISILPINKGTLDESVIDNYNQGINSYNDWVQQKASEYGFNFVDLRPHFKDEDGRLKSSFTKDGIHLTDLGYEAYLNQIRPLLQ